MSKLAALRLTAATWQQTQANAQADSTPLVGIAHASMCTRSATMLALPDRDSMCKAGARM